MRIVMRFDGSRRIHFRRKLSVQYLKGSTLCKAEKHFRGQTPVTIIELHAFCSASPLGKGERTEVRGLRWWRHLFRSNPHPPLSLSNGEATPICLNAKSMICQRYR